MMALSPLSVQVPVSVFGLYIFLAREAPIFVGMDKSDEVKKNYNGTVSRYFKGIGNVHDPYGILILLLTPGPRRVETSLQRHGKVEDPGTAPMVPTLGQITGYGPKLMLPRQCDCYHRTDHVLTRLEAFGVAAARLGPQLIIVNDVVRCREAHGVFGNDTRAPMLGKKNKKLFIRTVEDRGRHGTHI